MPRGSQPRVFCRQVGLSPLSAFDPGKTGISKRSGFVGMTGNAGFLMRLGLILGCMDVGPVWEQESGCWSLFLFFHRACSSSSSCLGAAAVVKLVKLQVQLDHCSFHPQQNPSVRLSPMNCPIWPESDRSDYLVVVVVVVDDWPEPARRLPPLCKALLPSSDNNTYSLVGGGNWGISDANKVAGSCARAFSRKNINKKGLKNTRMIWRLGMKKGFE